MKPICHFLLCGSLFLASSAWTARGAEPAIVEPLPPRPTYRIERNIQYGVAAGVNLRLDAYMPAGEGPFPGLLVIHGGAWSTGIKEQLGRYARRLAERGYAAFAVNYRLAPAHKFPAQIDDCRDALRWLVAHAEKFHVDVDRLGAIGYSAGGHLSALLATEPTPRARLSADASTQQSAKTDQDFVRLSAIAIGGAPCDFRDFDPDSRGLAFWLGGKRASIPQVYAAASPAAFVTPDDPPTFLWHGDSDRLVPLANPTGFADLLKKTGVETEFRVVKEGGHIYSAFDLESLEQAVDFFDKHLKSAALSQ